MCLIGEELPDFFASNGSDKFRLVLVTIFFVLKKIDQMLLHVFHFFISLLSPAVCFIMCLLATIDA